MMTGVEYSFQGRDARAMTAVMMPPRRKLMCFGQTLARSYAGETKLATMLTPSAAIARVTEPIRTRIRLSIRWNMSAGFVMTRPKTAMLPAEMTTEVRLNSVQ